MENNAGVVDLKSEQQRKDVKISDIRVRPHIAYLDFLKKNKLLEQAIEGTLPKEVEQAAKVAVAADLVEKHGKEKVRVFKDTEGNIAISVDIEGKDLERDEVNDYIKHYRLEKFIDAATFMDAIRTIENGQKYEVRSGYFLNRIVLVRGLDREYFGVDWHENYGHPLCEKHIYRVQRDGLPMRGRTFVCHLLDEMRDILIHESEIGIHII